MQSSIVLTLLFGRSFFKLSGQFRNFLLSGFKSGLQLADLLASVQYLCILRLHLRGREDICQLCSDAVQQIHAICKGICTVDCILPCNFLPVHDIAFYIAAQIADDTVFVYGFDLMEIDDRVFRKYGAVSFGFDDDLFNVGRKNYWGCRQRWSVQRSLCLQSCKEQWLGVGRIAPSGYCRNRSPQRLYLPTYNGKISSCF